jgi:hypothetical protein
MVAALTFGALFKAVIVTQMKSLSHSPISYSCAISLRPSPHNNFSTSYITAAFLSFYNNNNIIIYLVFQRSTKVDIELVI